MPPKMNQQPNVAELLQIIGDATTALQRIGILKATEGLGVLINDRNTVIERIPRLYITLPLDSIRKNILVPSNYQKIEWKLREFGVYGLATKSVAYQVELFYQITGLRIEVFEKGANPRINLITREIERGSPGTHTTEFQGDFTFEQNRMLVYMSFLTLSREQNQNGTRKDPGGSQKRTIADIARLIQFAILHLAQRFGNGQPAPYFVIIIDGDMSYKYMNLERNWKFEKHSYAALGKMLTDAYLRDLRMEGNPDRIVTPRMYMFMRQHIFIGDMYSFNNFWTNAAFNITGRLPQPPENAPRAIAAPPAPPAPEEEEVEPIPIPVPVPPARPPAAAARAGPEPEEEEGGGRPLEREAIEEDDEDEVASENEDESDEEP